MSEKSRTNNVGQVIRGQRHHQRVEVPLHPLLSAEDQEASDVAHHAYQACRAQADALDEEGRGLVVGRVGVSVVDADADPDADAAAAVHRSAQRDGRPVGRPEVVAEVAW